MHVGGLVAALLQQRAPLGLAQLIVQCRDGLLGIALDQVLDGGIKVILQSVGNDDVFPGLLEAVAELVEAPVLAREPPGRGADQRQPDHQNRARSDALRHRQRDKQGGQMGDFVTERLRGEKRDGDEQDSPGNQEKQPHRDVLTPAHIFAMIAIGERNRDQAPGGFPDVSGAAIHGWLRQQGWWRRVRGMQGFPGGTTCLSRHSGAARSAEPGIHWAAETVEEWIPGSRLRRAPE